MSDIHVGHINHEHYELIGQLADGTPIYRHCPPPPPDPKVLYEERKKVVENYNAQVDVKPNNPDDLLFKLHEDEKKEQEKHSSKILRNKPAEPIKPESIKYDGTLGYFEEVKNESTKAEPAKTNQYLELFVTEEQREENKRLRTEELRKRREKQIEKDELRTKENAAKYEALSESLREERAIELKDYQAVVEQIETILQKEYQQILKEDEFEDFYLDGDEYYVDTHVDTKGVTVTNKRTNAHKDFNYIGTLHSVNVKEHRLVLYSVVRGDSGYGILREGYRYVTHRSITYNLRTGRTMDKESSIISKVDPLRCDELDVDGGTTNRNLTLSAAANASNNCTPECWWEWIEPTSPVQIEIEPFMVDLNISQLGEPEQLVSTQVIPTEFVIQAWGSGGAGLSGVGARHGAPGGGGSYAEKTYRISPLQRYPVIVTVNVGTGQWLSGSDSANNLHPWRDEDTWDNNIIRPEKDTYAIVDLYQLEDANRTISPPITTCAGGGYDGSNHQYFHSLSINWELTGWAGYPGKPMGTYDVGYYGYGSKPWSTMKYFISAYTNEHDNEDWHYGGPLWLMRNNGWGANGAACTGHGFGIGDPALAPQLSGYGTNQTPITAVVYGGRGGRSADDNEEPFIGSSPGRDFTGGGGAGLTDGTSSGYYLHYVYLSGSSGAQGKLAITITKGIVNRSTLGTTLINE